MKELDNDFFIEFFKLTLIQNNKCISEFYEFVNFIFKKELEVLEKNKDNSSRFRHHKYNIEHVFPFKLSESTFLMLFGYLEEMIILFWQKINPQKIERTRENGIGQYKNYLKFILGNKFNNSDYQHIIEASKIRNSLLHCGGRVDLMKNPVTLIQIVNKSDNYFIDQSRIFINLKGLQNLQKANENFFKLLFKCCKSQGFIR